MPYHLATAPYTINICCFSADYAGKNDSDGNRTRVTAVKGRCLNRLTTEPIGVVFAANLATNVYYHRLRWNASVFLKKFKKFYTVQILVSKADERSPGQAVWVYGGRLQSCGKSRRSEAPPDGHRSDSTGKLYAFPFQRSSDSGREALRLSRPPGLRSAKIFTQLCRCPPHTHTTCHGLLSGFWGGKGI